MSDVQAIGDNFRSLRSVLDFLKTLNIDRRELLELVKMATALFADFSLDGVWAFVDALLKALEPAHAAAGEGTGLTADQKSALPLVRALFEQAEEAGK